MAEIPTEALEAGEFAALEAKRLIWPGFWLTEEEMAQARAAVTAAAPYLIAEGRRQVIAELHQLATPAGPLLTPLQIVKILELGARIAKGATDG